MVSTAEMLYKYQPLPKPPEIPPIIKEPNTVEENKNEPSKT